MNTYITTGEVTALQHEGGNDTMELGPSVAEALLSGAEGTEVLRGSGNDVVVEVEIDTTGLI